MKSKLFVMFARPDRRACWPRIPRFGAKSYSYFRVGSPKRHHRVNYSGHGADGAEEPDVGRRFPMDVPAGGGGG